MICFNNTQALIALVVIEKKIFPIISIWQILTPPGRGQLNPRGMVGRIYEGDYQTLHVLHSKYSSSGPCGFREEYIYVFPIVNKKSNLVHLRAPDKINEEGMGHTAVVAI